MRAGTGLSARRSCDGRDNGRSDGTMSAAPAGLPGPQHSSVPHSLPQSRVAACLASGDCPAAAAGRKAAPVLLSLTRPAACRLVSVPSNWRKPAECGQGRQARGWKPLAQPVSPTEYCKYWELLACIAGLELVGWQCVGQMCRAAPLSLPPRPPPYLSQFKRVNSTAQ